VTSVTDSAAMRWCERLSAATVLATTFSSRSWHLVAYLKVNIGKQQNISYENPNGMEQMKHSYALANVELNCSVKHEETNIIFATQCNHHSRDKTIDVFVAQQPFENDVDVVRCR
jgi:hypothetical protein